MPYITTGTPNTQTSKRHLDAGAAKGVVGRYFDELIEHVRVFQPSRLDAVTRDKERALAACHEGLTEPVIVTTHLDHFTAEVRIWTYGNEPT